MLSSLDLFSGYGGITYALRNYVRPIGYCEIEEYPRAILASRMESGELPFAPIYPDVKRLRGSVGAADIITGGFPCQDISVAGNGKGLEGERSGLFFEIVRLAKETRAPFVFLENVPAIRTRGLREVIRAFTEMGYDCRWTCISASSVGAPHPRERWFLLAYSNGPTIRIKQRWGIRKGWQGEIEFGGSLETRRSTHADSESEVLRQSSKRHKDAKFKWTLEGDDWDHHARELLRMGYGDAFRLDRVKALGNGVVPSQVKEAFEILMGLKVKRGWYENF